MTALTALKAVQCLDDAQVGVAAPVLFRCGVGSCHAACWVHLSPSSIGRTQDHTVSGLRQFPCDGATATMAANRGAGFSKNGSILSNVFWQYSAIRNVFHSWSMCCKLATTFTGLCHSRILRSKHLTLSTPERKLKGSKWWQNGHVPMFNPRNLSFRCLYDRTETKNPWVLE